MPIDVYFSFIAYACATTFLPGPNNVLLLASAGQFGLRKCVPLLLGIWTGLVTVMLIAGGFCSALGQLIPRIAPYFKYAGAAYILYLAWKTLMRKPVDENSADTSRPLIFRNGFLLQFLNVKVIMLGLASYPGYFLPYGKGPALVLLFAVTMTVCCGTGNLIWGAAGSILYRFYNKYYKAVNLFMALLLVYCALKIALS
jgi:cysteine/O-acetylserine efflux protein